MDMNTQSSSPITLPPDVDPQGIIGSFLGKMAGGAIGKHFGGGTGQTIGSVAGGFLGGLIPLSAEPGGAGQSAAVSDMELQSFWGTFKKIAGTVAQGAQTAASIGHNLGLFQAGPEAQGQVSDIELQSFWSTFKKIAGTVAQGAQTGISIGHNLGLFQAGPQSQGQDQGQAQGQGQGQGQGAAVSDIEMQSFWDTFKKIAGTVAKGVQTGVNVGHGLGLFQAEPQQGGQVDDLELQNFWKVWNKVADVAKNLGQVAAGVNQVAGGVAGIAGQGQSVKPQSAGMPLQLTPDQAMAILRQVSPVLQAVLQRPSGPMN